MLAQNLRVYYTESIWEVLGMNEDVQKRDLSECEKRLMSVIWEYEHEGELCPIRDLTSEMGKRFGTPYARTTVVTFLSRMEAKGYVKTRRKGRLSYVFSVINREEYLRTLFSKELELWFGGNLEGLVELIG
jgi:predicted transcriptional regulator